MANKPTPADFSPTVPDFPSVGQFQPIYGKFDLTTYIQGASDYEIMSFLVQKYNATLQGYAEVTQLSKDTVEAYNQLQNWVNTWFDNLDVSQEINSKIDAMVASGTFGELLHKTFDEQINTNTTNAVTKWLVDNVDPKGSAVIVDSSLSITGAAADSCIVGQNIQNQAICCSFNSVRFNLTKDNDTTFTVAIELSDSPVSAFIWNQHTFASRSVLTGKSASYTVTSNFNGGTFNLYYVKDNFEIHPNTDPVPVNSILLWSAYINNNLAISYTVFDVGTMALNKILGNVDITLSKPGVPADANIVGKYVNQMPIYIQNLNINVTFEKVSDSKLKAKITVNGSGFIWTMYFPYSWNSITNGEVTFDISASWTYVLFYTAGEGYNVVRMGTRIPLNSVVLYIAYIRHPDFGIQNVVFDTSYLSPSMNLSQTGYNADSCIVGQNIQNQAICCSFNSVRFNLTKDNDTTFTVAIELSDSPVSAFIWNQHTFASRSVLTGKSASYTVTSNFNGGTFNLYYVKDNFEIHPNTDPVPVNSILLWSAYINNNLAISYTVFDVGTMALNKLNNRITSIEDKDEIYDLIGSNTASIFTKVVCCGDSYTSGHISTSKGTEQTNEQFAWPKYAQQITGNTYVNCGKSGANVLTWQTDPRGLPAAQTAGLAQCYIIGLGLNDTAQGTSRYVELGETSDIGTDNQTYYGGYSKIIRELHAISPNAIIFCQTMPMASGIKLQYNEAIRTIVKQYAEEYNVKLLNLNDYDKYYRKPSVSQNASGGHYVTAGYQQLAQILMHAISDYINMHPTEFYEVHKIPYKA